METTKWDILRNYKIITNFFYVEKWKTMIDVKLFSQLSKMESKMKRKSQKRKDMTGEKHELTEN